MNTMTGRLIRELNAAVAFKSVRPYMATESAASPTSPWSMNRRK
jgi:hypothetical protein